MSVTGNLRTMAFADLLQWLSSAQKTGTLVIDGPSFTKKVYFRGGQVVAVASDNPRELLGYYLVGWGFLTEADLKYLIEMQDHFATMLGELVVKMGHLSQDELEQVMRVKTQEAIYDLIQWDEGEFRFLDDELPERDFLEFHLPVESFLYEGHRQHDERRRMRHVVPDSRHIPILIAQPERLTDDEMALATLIDGQRSIERIARECRVPEFTVLKFVYRCVTGGLMRVTPPAVEEILPGASDARWLEMARDAHDRIQQGQFLDALKVMTGLAEKHADDAEAGKLITTMQQQIEEKLKASAIDESAIIESAVDLNELVTLDCDPAEGFVLSRITGRYTVDEVLNQLPGSRLHNHVIIHNLIRRELVTLRPPTSLKRYQSKDAVTTPIEVFDNRSDPFQDEESEELADHAQRRDKLP